MPRNKTLTAAAVDTGMVFGRLDEYLVPKKKEATVAVEAEAASDRHDKQNAYSALKEVSMVVLKT